MRQSAALTAQPETAPTTVFETVVVQFPKAPPEAEDDRDPAARREWLTEREVEQLCDAAKKRGRWVTAMRR